MFGFSQKKRWLKVEPYEQLRKHFTPATLAFAWKDSLDTDKKLKTVTLHLHSIGFLLAGLDAYQFRLSADSTFPDTLICHFYVGTTYKKAHVGVKNINPTALRKTGLKTTLPEMKKFKYKEFVKAERSLVDYYQTIGFPFASVYLDSVNVVDGKLGGELKLVQGPFIVFDSLRIVGKTKTRKKFLGNYTRIKRGDPFNENTIENAYKLLKQLPYLKVGNYPTVAFINGKAFVTFYIEDKKANQVDGVVGFLPNQQSTTTGQAQAKLMITGEFNLNLKNMAGKGKALSIEWKRVKPLSQILNLEYQHPNLFNSPLNIIPTFNLQKQDTTFQTVITTLKTNFNLKGGGKMGLYLSTKQSRLISTSQYSGYAKPPFLDFNLNTYGVDYEWNNLDDYFYPKRGNWMFVDGNVGLKSIRQNSRLPERLYEGIQMNTTQFYLKGEFRHFFRTGKRNTLLSSLRAGRVFNDNALLTNDLFQLGGLKTLRGFNENFFFSEYYSTGTLEFRQFTDESSYLLLFVEKSFMNYRLGSDNVEDWPLGMGAGVSMSTNMGIFNFVYALGQSLTQKLQFSQSKVSFGYVSRF